MKKTSNTNKSMQLHSYQYLQLALVLIFVAVFTGIGSWFVASSHAQTGYCVNSTYRYGSVSGCVSDIQIILDYAAATFGHPYNGTKLVVDGDFGSKTLAQVKHYQGYFGLGADGIVGPKTWASLCHTSQRAKNGTYYFNVGFSAGCWKY
jgi:peptidoglycan hydrolase-like protein with peptidoglycan-binding domain